MTSQEIALQDIAPTTVAIREPNAALGQLMQHAQAMRTAHELAKALCASDLVPKDYRDKPGNGAAAILYGAELGLDPIQSLQQIFVVQGRPAIYARTMVALVKSRGYRIWTEASSDNSVTVVGQAPDGTAETSTWTFERAKKAGYTGNKKYETDPQAMLYAKAAAEVCRKLAPEVLLGVTDTREELDAQPSVRVQSERVAPGVSGLRSKLGITGNATVEEKEARLSSQVNASDEGEKPDSEAAGSNRAETAHLRKLFALLSGAGIAAKPDRLLLARRLLDDQELDSFSNLTTDQVDALLNAIGELGPETTAETVRQLKDETTIPERNS